METGLEAKLQKARSQGYAQGWQDGWKQAWMEIYSGTNPALQARPQQTTAAAEAKNQDGNEDEENIQICMNPEWVQWYTEYKEQQYSRSQAGQGSFQQKATKPKSRKHRASAS